MHEMNELLIAFHKLNKENKIEFVKKITPDMCEIFNDNPQEMMSICQKNEE